MTIWLLALVLMASLAALGYRQGAIRVAFSFGGIIFGALLAAPLAGLFRPLLLHVATKNPWMAWAIAPIIGFVLVNALFKVGGLMVHRKVEWKFKYRQSETRLALFIRLNTRLGACLGLLNATGYFVLICFYIFNISYWTVQISSQNSESHLISLVNRMGQDLESTGMSKCAKAVGKLPVNFYRFADLAGLARQNPSVAGRLADYPGLISLAQRDDLQALGQDSTFTGAWQQQAPINELLDNAQVQGLLKDRGLADQASGILDADYDDLLAYLKTGQSAKYSDKILGNWDFNFATTFITFRQSHPKLSPADIGQVRAEWTQAFAQTKLIFAGDNKVYLKQLPDFKSSTGAAANGSGDWSMAGSDYKMTVAVNGDSKDLVGTTDGRRLTIKGLDNVLVFDHE